MPSARLEVIVGDITKLEVDAIVNAANDRLTPGGGVSGAIHRAAGPGLARECAAIGHCPTGEARVTGGHDLAAKHIIHTVGPIWRGGAEGEPELLAGCYRSTLEIAEGHGLGSVAFPAISTGIYGYPLEAATRVAVATVRAALADRPGIARVVFSVFDERTKRICEAALAG
jgi:O-acetyl-ADP-ribose deacetylase (regulator of RNase III)